MILISVILCTFLKLTNSYDEVALITSSVDKKSIDDNILCRSCGFDISSSTYIFSKSSPASRYTFRDTLFRRNEVLVQVFLNDLYLHFPVLTTTHSTCMGIGEWEESDTWFPGYRWKPCVCPECGAYIGWVFEPINPDLVHPHSVFFGLILTSLIGESFVNSLTQYSGNLTY